MERAPSVAGQPRHRLPIPPRGHHVPLHTRHELRVFGRQVRQHRHQGRVPLQIIERPSCRRYRDRCARCSSSCSPIAPEPRPNPGAPHITNDAWSVPPPPGSPGNENLSVAGQVARKLREIPGQVPRGRRVAGRTHALHGARAIVLIEQRLEAVHDRRVIRHKALGAQQASLPRRSSRRSGWCAADGDRRWRVSAWPPSS